MYATILVPTRSAERRRLSCMQ